MNTFKQPARGFTLVELAMSLLVIGLLVGTLILPVTGQLNARAIDETEKTMENIKEALIGYAVMNAKLPCPAAVVSNPAVNDLGTSQSTLCGQEGFLPWAELGIGKVTDAWGFPIRYRVDNAYTAGIPSTLKAADNISVSRDTASGNVNLVSAEPDGTSKIIVLLLSYGNDHAPNGINTDGDTNYISNEYINGSFDDIVMWLPKTTLLARLAAANRYNYSTSP
ncbi:MAG: prepilin-type N-terminal cleavage/methylation domain-containing protein [Thiotrichaceae bacterium]|nr:prepilin-type N-terminal cleavage/methylation domain-containing protein [Thiotrichaceae bacterium]